MTRKPKPNEKPLPPRPEGQAFLNGLAIDEVQKLLDDLTTDEDQCELLEADVKEKKAEYVKARKAFDAQVKKLRETASRQKQRTREIASQPLFHKNGG